MWGDIDVKLTGQLFSGRRLCEYKNGKTTPKDTDLLDLKIVKVISSGGWGRMDFDIWVINDVMRIAEQGDLYHLYVMDKDMWLDREAMKRLYNLLGKNLGVENAVIKDGKVFVFTDDEEGEDECLRCSFANGGCANECICLVCFPDIQQVGKRFKLL